MWFAAATVAHSYTHIYNIYTTCVLRDTSSCSKTDNSCFYFAGQFPTQQASSQGKTFPPGVWLFKRKDVGNHRIWRTAYRVPLHTPVKSVKESLLSECLHKKNSQPGKKQKRTSHGWPLSLPVWDAQLWGGSIERWMVTKNTMSCMYILFWA